MTQKERTKKRVAEFKIARVKLSGKLLSNNKNPDSCEICELKASEDHHIIKKAEDNYKYNSDLNNLIRVCRSCHNLFHSHNTDELKRLNGKRFIECMLWIESQRKYSSLSCFERNLS